MSKVDELREKKKKIQPSNTAKKTPNLGVV